MKNYNLYTNSRCLYYDLNNDGDSEFIWYRSFYIDGYNRACLRVKNSDGDYIGIWNLDGEFIDQNSNLFPIGDFNNDGFSEIYVFSTRSDSIFINCIDYRIDGKSLRKENFVDKAGLYKGKMHIYTHPIGQQDMNNDGFNEIYFAIDAGYSITPRRIYAYDVQNDTIYKSPVLNVKFKSKSFILYDLNGDNKKELLISTHGCDNIKDTTGYPYHDNSSWLMAFTPGLEFLFPPVEFKGAPSALEMDLIKGSNEKIFYYGIYRNYTEQNHEIKLYLFDTKGKILRQRNLDEVFIIKDVNNVKLIRQNYYSPKYLPPDQLILFSSIDNVYAIFDLNLEIVKLKKLPYNIASIIKIDIEPDGEEELLLVKNKNNVILKQDFTHLATIRGLGGTNLISVKRQKGKNPKLYFQKDEKNYLFEYFKNPWHKFSWAVVSVFFVICLVFLSGIKKIRALIKKRNIQKQLKSTEQEKSRLAKELHDELGSRITGLKLGLSNIDGKYNLEELKELSEYLNETHREVRNIIYNLTPPQFSNGSFFYVLDQLCSEFAAASGMQFIMEVIPDKEWTKRIPSEVQKELYRIIRESFHNTLKYAEATEVILQLSKNKRYFEVYIQDNGKGFDYQKALQKEKSFGLKNMQLRAKLIKANIRIKTGFNEGTVISLQMPLKNTKGCYNSRNASND